jgi:hypothetical protein
MLVAAADVGCDRLDDYTVVDLLSLRRFQLRIVDALNFDFAGPEINYAVIGRHEIFSLAASLYESKARELRPPGTKRTAQNYFSNLIGSLRQA